MLDCLFNLVSSDILDKMWRKPKGVWVNFDCTQKGMKQAVNFSANVFFFCYVHTQISIQKFSAKSRNCYYKFVELQLFHLLLFPFLFFSSYLNKIK